MSRLESWERRTGPLLTGLAVIALVSLVVESAWNLQTRVATLIDYVTWAVFAVDYVTRIRLAEHRWRFIRNHPLDLIAVVVPAFRSLRLVAAISRIGALAQRGAAAERVTASTVLITLTVLAAGAAVALDAEREAPDASITSYGEAVWWALTTVTTVGYGDRYPITNEGRIVGGVLMVVGVAAMSAVTAAIATRLIRKSTAEEIVEHEETDHTEHTDQAERLRRLESQVARLADLLEAERAGRVTDPR